jgi:hypothetical protein
VGASAVERIVGKYEFSLQLLAMMSGWSVGRPREAKQGKAPSVLPEGMMSRRV